MEIYRDSTDGELTGLVEVKTIGVEKSLEILKFGLDTAKEMDVSGFLVVYSRTGMQECSQVIGSAAKPFNVDVALLKIKTVLAVRRSTRLQMKRMEELGQRLESFGNILGTDIAGGVAIFSNEDLKEFVGAVAFSGGLPAQDEIICQQAVTKAGLHTDLPPITPITPIIKVATMRFPGNRNLVL